MASQDPMIGEGTIEELDTEQCHALLSTTPVGRLVFVDDGQPLALPVNFAIHERTVVFRTARGSVLDGVADAGERVAFQADAYDLERRTGWSVLLKGRAEAVTDPAAVAALGQLELRSWLPDLARLRWVPETPAWEPVQESRWVRVHADETTGRRTVSR